MSARDVANEVTEAASSESSAFCSGDLNLEGSKVVALLSLVEVGPATLITLEAIFWAKLAALDNFWFEDCAGTTVSTSNAAASLLSSIWALQ